MLQAENILLQLIYGVFPPKKGCPEGAGVTMSSGPWNKAIRRKAVHIIKKRKIKDKSISSVISCS
jgi:hypothetical protein